MDLDYTKPVEIAENVFWVGAYIPEDPFQCHTYLIKNGEHSVLIDPGSKLTLPLVLEKIYQVCKLRDIRYFIFHHQDPDITGCFDIIEELLPPKKERFIITHWRAQALLKHFNWKTPFYLVDKHNWRLKAGERELEFIFTPYAHFPGAFCTFDKKTRTLFSSDIFGALCDEFKLFYEGEQSILEGIKFFHKHYMPSKLVLNHALDQILEKDPLIIAPQHGSIIKKPYISEVVNVLRKLNCGLYLVEKAGEEIGLLSEIEEKFNKFMETIVLESDYQVILLSLYKNLKEYEKRLKEFYVLLNPSFLKRTSKRESFFIKVEKEITFVEKLEKKHLSNFLEVPLLKGGFIPKILLTFEKGELPEEKKKFFEVFLNKIISPLETILKRDILIDELQKEKECFFERSIKDYLTGLYNRYYLIEYLKTKLEEVKKESYSLCIAMIDIDFFKKINDTYGHLVGDEVLKGLANLLRNSLRKQDIVARYGGEEFLVVMPFASIEHACRRIEEIRKKVASFQFANGIKITISAGVSEYKLDDDIESLIKRADENLYLAKETGRNKVVCDHLRSAYEK